MADDSADDRRPSTDLGDRMPPVSSRPPAFRGDAAFRDDRFDDPRERERYGTTLAAEIALDDALPLASRMRRLAAWIVDHVLFILSVVPGSLMLVSSGVSAANPFGSSLAWFGWMMIGASVAFVLYAVMVTRTGQSVGKLVFGIRIVDAADGSNPGFWRAVALRFVIPEIVYLFVPVLAFFGDTIAIFGGTRQCLHDRLAQTVVVRVQRGD